MQEAPFREVVRRICRKDPRYAPEAYLFVRETLDFTARMLEKPQEGLGRHVSGQELLEGVRAFALQQFGPMALTVLEAWGIRRTEDVGEIVFNLVETGKLGKTENDTRGDFAGGYDFQKAFGDPFLPKSKPEETGSQGNRQGGRPTRRPPRTDK